MSLAKIPVCTESAFYATHPNNHIPYVIDSLRCTLQCASGLWHGMASSCGVCGKSLPRSNQRRVLGGESSSLSSANATEFLKFVGTSVVERSWFVCRQPCFALLEKGHKTLLALKSTVNTLRAQLGLTPVSIAISQEPPTLQLVTAATASRSMGGGPVGGDTGHVDGGDVGTVVGGDAGPVDGGDASPRPMDEGDASPRPMVGGDVSPRPMVGGDVSPRPVDGGDVHRVNTGVVAGGDLVGGTCTPRPKAKRSLSYGTPQSAKKALSLKVLYYI